ncbi:DNA replication terminus site-binding protein [Halomonas piscis]|uniref:DNA replication terminus site-binding protein n=1 Tax=Halomonas piscis TaxID=3031727 RepID=UPI0028A1CAB1|nr:DNA replication terminus site-binding protein [Halomonas piscis]
MPGSSAPSVDYRLLHRLDGAFDDVLAALEAVMDQARRSAPGIWALNDAAADAGWLEAALFDMWHTPGQDGRQTRNYVGLVAADEALLAAVTRANAAKIAFSECLQAIKQQAPALLSEGRERLPRRHPGVEKVLEQNGLARLHLKQCWRHLPVAEAPVSRVRFAWYSSGRSIKRLSVQEAEQKLLALDSDAPHVRIQLRRLAGIPSSEPLAQVQPQAPLMRANLFFTEPVFTPTAPDGHSRRALNVAMPIFVPAPEGRLPHTNRPPAAPPEKRTRARRRDEKLEHEPFLPSLRVYRYR